MGSQKLCSFLLTSLLVISQQAIAHDEMGDMDHHHHHEMHDAAKRSEANFIMPDVTVTNQKGEQVKFSNEVNDNRVAVVSFIYTSCNAICPMTSQIIYKLQTKLGKNLDKVHLISVSIDPEQDTPEKLASFAEKYHASKSWDYYTGSEQTSVAIQKAFDAYRGDKMNHAPVTLIKAKNGKWVRYDGFATVNELHAEVLKQLK